MGPVAIALLGVTHPHSGAHLNTLLALDLAERVVLCPDAGEAVPPEMTQGGKALETLSGVEELATRRDVPIVFVTLRNRRVREAAVRLVEAGKHLFCEKPVGCSSADAQAVLEAADRRGPRAGVCLPFRAHPCVREMRRLVESGALGRIIQVEARMTATQVRLRDPKHWLFSKSEAGGGVLSWLGCHWFDALRYVLRDEVAAVSGRTETLSGEAIDVEDCACLSLRFRGGAIGSMTAGYALPLGQAGYHGSSYDTTVRLWGTRGRVVWEDSLMQTNLLVESLSPEWADSPQQEMRFNLAKVRAYGGAHGLQMARDFVRATAGECDPPTTMADAVAVHRILEAAYEASATGREVRVS